MNAMTGLLFNDASRAEYRNPASGCDAEALRERLAAVSDDWIVRCARDPESGPATAETSPSDSPLDVSIDDVFA